MTWIVRGLVVVSLALGGCDQRDGDGGGEIGRIALMGVDDDYVFGVTSIAMFIDRPLRMAPLADAKAARERDMGECGPFSYGGGGGGPLPGGLPGSLDAGPTMMFSTAEGDWLTLEREDTDDGEVTYSGSGDLVAAPWGQTTDFRIDPGGPELPALGMADAITLSGRIRVTSPDPLAGTIEAVRGEPLVLGYAVEPPAAEDVAYLLISGQGAGELFLCRLDPEGDEVTIPVDIIDRLTGDIGGLELWTTRQQMIELERGPVRVDAVSMTRWPYYF